MSIDARVVPADVIAADRVPQAADRDPFVGAAANERVERHRPVVARENHAMRLIVVPRRVVQNTKEPVTADSRKVVRTLQIHARTRITK